MIKKIVYLTLALVAFSAPADVVIPLTQDVAVPVGVQKPTDAVKYFYAKCDTLPETGKNIELATNKNSQLSIKEVKSFEVKALEAAFAKKQNVAVLFVVPNTENSFVLQVTFNATATQPDGKTKQPSWTDVRIYGNAQTCPKSVDAFVKRYFSPSRFWRNVAGTTAGVVGLSFLAFSKYSTAISFRRPTREVFVRTYEYDENLDIAQNAKLAFAFHGIGDENTFITLADFPISAQDPSKIDPAPWVSGNMNNRILIITKSYFDTNWVFFIRLTMGEKLIEDRVLVLNNLESQVSNLITKKLGFSDGRPLSEIKRDLTSDYNRLVMIWNRYQECLIQVRVS